MNKCNLTIAVLAATFALIATTSNFASATGYKYKMKCHGKRSAPTEHPHSMMHHHLSRKVFDRACSASKDSIDEIVACITGNESLIKAVDVTVAAQCYKDAFGQDFDPKDLGKHKDLICNNHEKFETLTACVYRKTASSLSSKQMEKVTEAIVDVGLCIINALDG